MTHFNIQYTRQALDDIRQVVSFIRDTCSAPITAKKYAEGLIEFIKSLSHSAHSFPVSLQTDVLQYGANARRVHYKRKMSVIYTISRNKVIIHRIIPSSIIKK
jgi:plasmid stabilization system protein ParE